LRVPSDHAYAAAHEPRRSWLLEKVSGKLSRKDTELKS
jgi:hypothetical protein